MFSYGDYTYIFYNVLCLRFLLALRLFSSLYVFQTTDESL